MIIIYIICFAFGVYFYTTHRIWNTIIPFKVKTIHVKKSQLSDIHELSDKEKEFGMRTVAGHRMTTIS